ncbi:MAG: diaminopimelate epimerase, partial [Chloroflexi bacterium RBG_16_50_9]
MNFTKMHGAGNDFVVINTGNTKRDWTKLAITICDRHRGIGADSLLLLLPSKKADFTMRTFDADGSEAETCGNGLRCLARYALEKGVVRPDTKEISIETLTRIVRVKFEERNGEVIKFWANMGLPEFGAENIPVNIKAGKGKVADTQSMINYTVTVDKMVLELNLVSMGNPHAVYFCQDSVAEFPLSRIGSLVENLPIFPTRINFEIARVLSRQ